MVECGICGTDKRPLYCSRCTTHFTLRSRINVIKVTTQLDDLRATVSEAIDGKPLPPIPTRTSGGESLANHTTTDTQSDGLNHPGPHISHSPPPLAVGNEAQTRRLHSQIKNLQNQLSSLQAAKTSVNSQTAEIRQQTLLIRQQIDHNHQHEQQMRKYAAAQFSQASDTRTGHEKALKERYNGLMHLSLGLQSKCCQDLLEIFALKKKRKKSGYEIVLGFAVVPELSQLGHYSITTINSGLERVCTFTILLANYLGLQLPHELQLPQRARPRVLIGPGRLPLRLPHSVKTMMRSSPREFHSYCRLLAMLVINVAIVAQKLGLGGLVELQDISRLNQLVAQIYLRIEALIKQGHTIKIYSGSLETDLDALQDHIITAIDVDLNGASAEWNIIEVPPED